MIFTWNLGGTRRLFRPSEGLFSSKHQRYRQVLNTGPLILHESPRRLNRGTDIQWYTVLVIFLLIEVGNHNITNANQM